MAGKNKKSLPKIKLTALGKKLYNGLTYSVSIENTGASTQKGFCLSLAGDAVDNGGLKAKTLYLRRLNGNEVVEIPFERVTKKDGNIALMAKAEGEFLGGVGKSQMLAFPSEEKSQEYFLDSLSKQVSLKFDVEYRDSTEREVLITVFPYDNVITGTDSVWRTATSEEL